MIDVSNVNRNVPALTRNQLGKSFNRTASALTRDTVRNINLGKKMEAAGADRIPGTARAFSTPGRAPVQAAPGPRPLKKPDLLRPVQRGQKIALGIAAGSRTQLRAGFGWNVRDARCDIDVSAFLLSGDRRVPSDEWFVFYGQPVSPDGAVRFSEDGREDREIISLDLGRLSPEIQRVVFVMTIDQAAEHGLNFGMIQEAWMRITDSSGRELVGYSPSELFENVTSMTLGELYLRNGEWRFNPVGNGVNTDLAGQCAVYGVEISG